MGRPKKNTFNANAVDLGTVRWCEAFDKVSPVGILNTGLSKEMRSPMGQLTKMAVDKDENGLTNSFVTVIFDTSFIFDKLGRVILEPLGILKDGILDKQALETLVSKYIEYVKESSDRLEIQRKEEVALNLVQLNPSLTIEKAREIVGLVPAESTSNGKISKKPVAAG